MAQKAEGFVSRRDGLAAEKKLLERRAERARASIDETVSEIRETVGTRVRDVKETIEGVSDFREQFASEPVVWLICGFLVPLTFFPYWVRPISWILAPTWGMNAIRESSLGGSPLPDLLMCFALGTAYIALGFLVMDRLLRAARERAALSLT